MENSIVKTEPLINPVHELFCQNYVNNPTTQGNATLSLAEANEMDADYKGTDEQKSAYNVAKSSASRLLTNANVRTRVVQLWNNLMKDEIVDAEHAKIIFQDGELNAKMAAIKEYNRLRKRATDTPPNQITFFQKYGKLENS